MFDGVDLEKEQIELLALLAEAVRRVPPDKRAKFLFVETFGGASIVHSGLPGWSLEAYKGDIELLARKDFLLLSYTSRGSIQFDITPKGFEHLAARNTDPGGEVSNLENTAFRFYGLDQLTREILGTILRSTQLAGVGIDAMYYRAQHDDQLDALDKLERNGLLRKDLDKYWVTLSGLRLLDDERSNALLQKFEKIFDLLRQQYKAKPKSKVRVADIAQLSGLTFKETAECLVYMVQVPWLGAYTNTFDNPAESYIQPSEEVLRYKTFKNITTNAIRTRSEAEIQLVAREREAVMPVRSQQKSNKAGQTTELSFIHSNGQWVIIELEKIMGEWEAWSNEVGQIADQPYDRNTQSEVYADGESMMHKQEVLQSKTRVFLDRNVRGHNFVAGFDGSHVDRTDLRLKHRVKHRIQDLRVLHACLKTIQSEEKTEPESSMKAGTAPHAQREILQLKPTFFGIGIDLKALWKKWQSNPDK
ncbi:MAG: hypothetical protein ACT4PN_04740 [Nitrospiraceae bacterium]